jgi:hypothetical protein
MELKELLEMMKNTRPWILFLFCLIAFQSLQNASPPDFLLTPAPAPLLAVR